MTLHLIRHASAGRRGGWAVDDLERPLDDRGRAQAEAVAAHLAEAPLRGVLSSMAVRCVQTVAPLATASGFDVDVRRELTEGARASQVLELLRAEAHLDGDLVLCSHGDLIPEALNRLLHEGTTVVGGRGCAKGSIWSLETRGRDIVRATYVAEP